VSVFYIIPAEATWSGRKLNLHNRAVGDFAILILAGAIGFFEAIFEAIGISDND
jgi:hypothetical protein